MLICPYCSSTHTKKNGCNGLGKPKRSCLACHRQYVQNPQKKLIPMSTRNEIRQLLLERISLRGICRLKKVSMPWLLKFIRQIEASQPSDLNAHSISYALATVAMDEQHSYVGNKTNRQWLWLAFSPQTRQVLAMHVGSRDLQNAQALLARLPDDLKKKRRSIPTNFPSTTKPFPGNNTVVMESAQVLQLTWKDFTVRLDRDALAS